MSSDSSTTSSGSSIGAAVVFNGALFLIFFAAFLILRPRQKYVYQPRSTIDTIPENERPKPLRQGPIAWLVDLMTRSDARVLGDAGLDSYFFLRYLRLVFLICLVGVVMLYPILLAVNATGGGNGTDFDLLSFGNIVNPKRYYAHVFLGWFFFGFILFTLYRELLFYVAVRQGVLTSPAYSGLVSSRTILLTTIPKDFLTVEALASVFDGVKYVFINRKAGDLPDKVKERSKLANKIEAAEVKMLKLAVKNKLKADKKGESIEGDVMSDYVPDKKRPTYRLKPIIGKKVDTINYGGERVKELNTEIADLQKDFEQNAPLNSAFVTFHTQEQAEIGYQVLAHHVALHMAPRYIGIRPSEIVWFNLRVLWWERLFRGLGAAAFLTALVIFWAIPVAFVGALSNLKNLTDKVHFLKFILNLPPQLFGLISSILPTVLLAVLMMLLPIIIRKMAMIAGRPSTTLIEYYTQNAYFAFQVVQVFLVTTISSAATSVVTSIISDPSDAMFLLAQKLPAASNFYISYFLLLGLSASSGMILQIVALILFHVLGAILDGTPRKKWSRINVRGGTGWGTVFPVYTNLAVILITYSIISPILLGFGAVTFGLLYIAYLHNLTFVSMPTDGRGIFYARAVFQTFTGLYLAQVCLLGLFVVAKAWGPVALQVIFLLFTVFVQLNLQSAFGPLLHMLPRNLMRENDEKNVAAQDGDEKGIQPSSMERGGDQVRLVGSNNSDQPEPVSGNSFTRYFAPHKFLTPSILQRELLTAPIFSEFPRPLTQEEESTAYCHPAALDSNPVVWIPKDPFGLSAQEVTHLQDNTVDATDRGTWFDIDEQKRKYKFAWGPINDIPIWSPPASY
jgi:calcium permeable stress-gated cation channel